MKLNNEDEGMDAFYPLLVCALAAVGLVALTLFAYGADSDQPCLTQQQARAKWPKEYLYWHTINHCWDNVRSYAVPDRTHKGRKAPAVKETMWNEYNEIDAAADKQTYFDANGMQVWRVVPMPKSKFKPWDDRIGL